MIGAIIGDIIGSRFEHDNYRKKDFTLFTKECRVTDDSVMTLAVAKALMKSEKLGKNAYNNEEGEHRGREVTQKMTINYLQEFGRKYPNAGYGRRFSSWLLSEDPNPYNSFGNGSAMRISPAAYMGETLEAVKSLAEAVTKVTHNHPEGLKGAEATAVAIFMARKGHRKTEIRKKISEEYYSLDFTIDEIRDSYEFDPTCQGSVPQAIVAFLEARSFEDAIRTAISLGGDSDTIAAITGSIAAAYYGVPNTLKEEALSYLDKELLGIVNDWYSLLGKKAEVGKFHVLTKYIDLFSKEEAFSKELADGAEKDRVVDDFTQEFNDFVESHPEYKLSDYFTILETIGLRWDDDPLRNAKVENFGEHVMLAFIMIALRADRFSKDTLQEFIEEGHLVRWLKRLREIDGEN